MQSIDENDLDSVKRKRVPSSTEKVINPSDKKYKADSARCNLFTMASETTESNIAPLEAIMKRLDKLDTMENDLKRLALIETNIQVLQDSVNDYNTSLAATNSELVAAKQEIELLKEKCSEFENLKHELSEMKSKHDPLEKKYNN